MSSQVRATGKTNRVVAVVLNWNTWAETISCVESLLRSSRIPDQIVVLDNGSIDDSPSRLREWARRLFAAGIPLVFIATGENHGYAGGNNVGIRYALRHANADFVWILNSDVVVDERALEMMLATVQSDDSIAMVGSKLLRYEAPDTIQALGGGHIIPVLCHDTQLGSGCKAETGGTAPIELDHVIGASLLVRAQAIRSVGLIDESYFLYREETDWCIRMHRAGWRLVCAPQAAVWHKQSLSVGFKSPIHDYYSVRNVLRLVRKFYPASLPTAFGYYALRSLLPKILRLEFARIGAVLAALRDFLSGVSGRPAAHSDRVLMRDYVNAAASPATQTQHTAGARASSTTAAA